MGDTTPIQWCDCTVNPVMGCEGCELWTKDIGACYAGQLHERFGAGNSGYAKEFTAPELFPGRMEKAARWSELTDTERPEKPWLKGRPRLIFVSDMGDALSSRIAFDFLREEVVTATMSEKGSRHRWLWLTKRPGRMASFADWLLNQGVEWPSNLWVGTSVTGPDSYGRAEQLLSVGSAGTIRFLSVEPQIHEIDIRDVVGQYDWIIHGGESTQLSHAARPFHVEWAKKLLEDCRAAGVPYFLKQLGSNVWHRGKQLNFADTHGGDWEEWPKRLRVRRLPRGA